VAFELPVFSVIILTRVDDIKDEREPSKQQSRISHKGVKELMGDYSHMEARHNLIASILGKEEIKLLVPARCFCDLI
jgi:hypothetical protein